MRSAEAWMSCAEISPFSTIERMASTACGTMSGS